MQMGVVSFKSKKEVVVRDSALQGKEIRIPTAHILREQVVPSLMPGGLADQLKSRQEFLDLAKFLSVLGRPGDFANNESPVLRKWRLGGTLKDSVAEGVPAYSTVRGELPDVDLSPFGETVYARSVVDVFTAGPVQLDINSTVGLRAWSGDTEIVDFSAPISFKKGKVTLTFAVDRKKRGAAGLRVELTPVPGSPAKFQPEGGQ